MPGRSTGAIGWAAAAVFFAALLISVFRVEYIGFRIEAAMVIVAAVSFLSPRLALPWLAALVPIAGVTLAKYANPAVAWPEAVIVASLAGFCAHALTPAGRRKRVHPSLAVPAVLFGALTVASMVVSLGVMRLRLGPVFTEVLISYITRSHFFDVRSFPALHAGLLLLEGLLLFAVAVRESETNARVMWRVAEGAAAGAALAAAMNVDYLVTASARGEAFWPTLTRYATTIRWNVHYPDYNAAGSYFVMGALLAAGAAAAVSGIRRALWAAASLLVLLALWLTGSRAAVLAGILALAGAVAVRQLGQLGTQRLRRAAAVAAAACVLAVGLTLALPTRGNQKSSFTAADVRVGLAQTSARMIASRPVFGIGLGEFYQRSGEFSSPELIALFPVAVHENAHNNFLQVAAELGLAGGLAFAWLIASVLALAARGAARGRGWAPVLTCAGLAAFVISWLGGHPLLIPPAAFAFWIIAGAISGGLTASDAPLDPVPGWRTVLSVGLVLIALALPWRMRAMLRDADLEHVGIGVSGWTSADDSDRYRTAVDHATLFVPSGTGFRLRVKPLTDRQVPLELRLDGRVADVISLAPNEWNDVVIPPRTQRAEARFARLDLRLLTPADPPITIRVTKVQPIENR